MAEEIRNKFVSWTLNVVKQKQGGNFYGVGVNLALMQTPTTSGNTHHDTSSSSSSSSSSYNRVGIESVEPSGPAAKAGIQSGDIIVKVDGKNFNDGKVYLPDDVAVVIRGPEGSTVDVIVERDGETLEFAITREPIGVVSSPPLSPSRKGEEEKKRMSEDTQNKNESAVVERGKKSENKSERMDKQQKKRETKNNNSGREKKDDINKNRDDKVKAVEAKKNNIVRDSSINSLKLSEEEEHKGKDLASSAEDADKFDDIAPSGCSSMCNIIPSTLQCGNIKDVMGNKQRCNSIDDISEEKTVDNNEEVSSIINSVGENEWELISERSGSAIVISFSGSMSGASFRSASPSVLKNKFVLTESTGEAYIEHVVLPTDTLQGLCLAYKISATRLRMENNFSGNSLQMAPKKLKIPTNVKSSKGVMIRVQDRTSKEYKLYAFVAEMNTMELVEAKAYLDLSNWDLDEALRSARDDEGFGFEPTNLDMSPLLSAVAKPKALTAQDIYSAPPPFDGQGFELKDIVKREES